MSDSNSDSENEKKSDGWREVLVVAASGKAA